MKYRITAILLSGGLLAASCSQDAPDNKETKPEAPSGYVGVKILEYNPAPGQFVNEMPEYEEGMTAAQMLDKVEKAINAGELVTLGSWGGSIIYKTEKYIANKSGADFRIVGNAYYSSVIDGVQYGSSEPGVVFVMKDSNGNGKPDDIWYELRGSASEASKIAVVTYSERQLTDDTFDLNVSGPGSEIQHWTTNPEFHPHSYMPKWLKAPVLRYDGVMLPANGIRLENGQYTQECYTGYADSQPNNNNASALDISSAMTLDGQPADLDRIDFIKVQTGVLQFNGQIGECSTEVGRIQVL
ncbi:MAG: hypothetical protein K2L96_02005 [Muribaculaceae bacterium]|nr:hypothetical protein [Muribaculaceae bacterium]